MDWSKFDIPEGYDWTTSLPRPDVTNAAGAAFSWLPLIPALDKVPEGFELQTIAPHAFKQNLVFQVVFAGDDPSETISVFETKDPELLEVLSSSKENGKVSYITAQREGILLMVVGEYDEKFLANFISIFVRDDEKAKQLLQESAPQQ